MAYKNVNGKLVKITKASHTSGYRTTVEVKPPVKEEFPEDKGQYDGSCNRRACLAPNAVYWNRGSYAYYCARCAWMLNNANSNTSFVKEGGPMCRIVLESEINKPIRQSRD